MTTPLPNLPYGTPLKGSAATAWAEQILSDIGAPQTAADIQSLIDWFAREGGGGENNPLNTTLKGPGYSGSINSVGVASYSSPLAGAAADAATISGGNYPAILADLKSGKGIVNSTDPRVASELQTWSGGGYSSVTGSGYSSTPYTPATGNTSGSNPDPNATLTSLNPFSVFTSLGNFFGDLTSADLWERIGLIIVGILLVLIGFIILAAGPTLNVLGMGGRASRGIRSITRLGATDSGGPTAEEQADRSRRLQLAESNTEIGRQKVEVQMMRERRLAGGRHSGGREPNPAPPHS